MRFYTWKDIERYILMHHDEWKDELYDIEVYPNEMVVYPKSEQGTLQNAVLKKLFPKNIAPDNLSIKLDGQGEDLMILYEYEYSPVTVRTLPLFKKAIYEDSIYPTEQWRILAVRFLHFILIRVELDEHCRLLHLHGHGPIFRRIRKTANF